MKRRQERREKLFDTDIPLSIYMEEEGEVETSPKYISGWLEETEYNRGYNTRKETKGHT